MRFEQDPAFTQEGDHIGGTDDRVTHSRKQDRIDVRRRWQE